jgi:c-di-GMP-binding flagellar brake protein YcgR
MPDYTQAETTALGAVSESDRYVLHSQAEIRSQLLNLAKKPDIITAYFDDGRSFILTAVLGIVRERNLVVLDVGPDDATTRRAIAARKLVCSTRNNGIPIRFSCENMQSAKYQGKPAIAAPIPTSLYRQQRREFFRVQTPRINAPTCEIPLEEGGRLTLKVADLSVGGLCLIDQDEVFQTNILEHYNGCILTLPEYGELTVDLQIRNKALFYSGNAQPVPRYGAAFENLSNSDSLYLQRYIYQLQALLPTT